jgi:hypothetical protein
MKKLGFVGVAVVFLFVLSCAQFSATMEPVRVSASSQEVMFVIDGEINEFFTLDPIGVSGANGSRDDVPPEPANQEDFGGDGTITELYATVQGGSLFLAVRGDMFGEPDGDNNAHLILLDLDPGAGTGAKDVDDGLDGFGDDGDPSDLTDVSDNSEPESRRPRSVISDAGANLSEELLMQGLGWDMAVSLTGLTPDTGAPVGGVFSWGSAGLPGDTANFAALDGSLAYDLNVTPFGPGRGAMGTVVGTRDGFEVAIPLAQLGLSSGEHMIRLVALTTSDTGYPSPNNLPESSDLANAGHGTMVIDVVATITITVP